MLSGPELVAIAEVLSASGTRVAAPLRASQITSGRSNVTLRLTDGVSAWVLRMPPRIGATPSAHDVVREFRITSALLETPVPVPRAVVMSDGDSPIGMPFAVADFVTGTVLRSAADLEVVDDAALEAVVAELVRVLAALHHVDIEAHGLADLGRPGSYAARQLRRWSGQWELVRTDDQRLDRDARALSAALNDVLPTQSRTALIHGDYRIDNTILDLDGPPRVAAVVDWELSTIGDPIADVAMMCAYRDEAFDLILGTPTAWANPRIPASGELAAMYECASGVPLEHWRFHLALAQYKIAVIAAGIAHRHRSGASSGEGFNSAGDAVGPYLAAGLATIEGAT